METIKVLLCAPTGKAAFNIRGSTLHSAFKIPVEQCNAALKRLSSNVKNQLCSLYRDLKLLIIDEISMVSSKLFHHLDSRMKELFNENEPFGGISLLAFGDFNQLHPCTLGSI